MKINQFRWLFIAVLTAVLIISSASDFQTIGLTSEWNNGRYYFAGGTALWALAYALVLTGLYFLLMNASSCELGQPLPGVFRRFVAFWLDFILAIFAVGPVLGILPALTEWRRTGVFAWSFERTTPAPGDTLLAAVGLLLGLTTLVFYYALPLVLGKPSPGTCIVGYQVIPDEGKTLSFRRAVLRTLLGFIAPCAAYLAPFISRDRKNGKFWLDKIFGTRAVKLK
jgi:hypothetical protein